MSALKDRLKADLTTSMKARDDIRLRTIRMALAAINVEEVAGKAVRELSDDEIVKVLTKEAKKRREAAEAFAGAGREQQAQAELEEQAVLEAYLPAQLSDAELGRARRRGDRRDRGGRAAGHGPGHEGRQPEGGGPGRGRPGRGGGEGAAGGLSSPVRNG